MKQWVIRNAVIEEKKDKDGSVEKGGNVGCILPPNNVREVKGISK